MDRANRNIPALIGLTMLQLLLVGAVFYAGVSAAVSLDACTYRGCGRSWWGAQAINLVVGLGILILIATVVVGVVIAVRGRAGHRMVGAGCLIQALLLVILVVVGFLV